MAVTVMCSWCHEMGEPGMPCRVCGHFAGVARMDCECPKCNAQVAQAMRRALAEDSGGTAARGESLAPTDGASHGA